MSIFSKFLSKHSKELKIVGGALNVLLSALPLGKSEKAKVVGAIAAINEAAESIEASLDSVKKMTEIKISKDDVEAVVKKLLPDMVSSIVEELAKKAIANTIAQPPEVKSDAK